MRLFLFLSLLLSSCSKSDQATVSEPKKPVTKSKLGIILSGRYRSNIDKTKNYFLNESGLSEEKLKRINFEKVFGAMIHEWNEKDMKYYIVKTEGTIFTEDQKPILDDYSDFEKVAKNQYQMDIDKMLVIFSEDEYYILIYDPRLTTREYFSKVKNSKDKQ